MSIPWWHYFERVPNPGGGIPYDWVDVNLSRHVTSIDRHLEPAAYTPTRCPCGKTLRSPEPGQRHCYQCRDVDTKREIRLQSLKNGGMCTTCWGVKPEKDGKRTCDRCLSRKRIQRAKKIEDKKNARR